MSLSSLLKRVRHLFTALVAVLVLFLIMPTSNASAFNLGSTVLSIPSVGVNTHIVHIPIINRSWRFNPYELNAGHLQMTSWVGGGSNIVIGGHSELPDMQPGVFFNLTEVNVGDEILLAEGGSEVRYIVTETRVVPRTDISVVMPTDGERLTLMTCMPGTFSAEINDYLMRQIVVAQPVQ